MDDFEVFDVDFIVFFECVSVEFVEYLGVYFLLMYFDFSFFLDLGEFLYVYLFFCVVEFVYGVSL